MLADGGTIGKSLAEADLVDEAKAILDAFAGKVPVPIDVVVRQGILGDATADAQGVEDVEPDDMILDIGPQIGGAALKTIIAKAGTIVWNGPVGVFEFDAFAGGTEALAERDRRVQGVLHRRRRRHAGGDRQVRHRRQDRLHLHRRRRLPRIPRRQDAAGRRDARDARG